MLGVANVSILMFYLDSAVLVGHILLLSSIPRFAYSYVLPLQIPSLATQRIFVGGAISSYFNYYGDVGSHYACTYEPFSIRRFFRQCH